MTPEIGAPLASDRSGAMKAPAFEWGSSGADAPVRFRANPLCFKHRPANAPAIRLKQAPRNRENGFCFSASQSRPAPGTSGCSPTRRRGVSTLGRLTDE
jgi:hypothetical protein